VWRWLVVTKAAGGGYNKTNLRGGGKRDNGDDRERKRLHREREGAARSRVVKGEKGVLGVEGEERPGEEGEEIKERKEGSCGV